MERMPFSLPTDHSLHPHAVQTRVACVGNGIKTDNAQSRAQPKSPEDDWKSKKSPISKVNLLNVFVENL